VKKPKNPDHNIIKQFIEVGEFDTSVHTVKQMCDDAGGMLDSASSHEICGCPLFKCADGKWYTGSVEFSVDPVNPAYLVDTLLGNECCECSYCGNIDQLEHMSEIGDEDTSGDGLCSECNHLSYKISKARAEVIAGITKPKRQRRVGLK
jgi:hypothetical protein